MAKVFADRVKETTTTTGTGTLNLGGAATGFQGFVAGIGTTNECSYCITDDTDWEIGEGTVTDASPDTLSRSTILASSNSDAAVNWSSGTKNVFVVYPAGAVAVTSYTNSTNNRVLTSVDSFTVNGEANLTFDGSVLAATGNITATGTVEPAGGTAAGDNAAIGYASADGLILTGQGSTNDVTIKNDADGTVISIPTGTTNVTIAGDLTISGDDLTMATNTSGAALIADGTNFNPVVISGDISINTSGVAAIANDAVTLAKMASGTAGNIVSYDASGNPVAIATGSDGEVLTSAGAGQPPAFEAAGGGGGGGAYTSITNTEVTATTNIDFTGFSSGTYDNYEIWVNNVQPATEDTFLELETSSDGGSSYDTSGYHYAQMINKDSGATANPSATAYGSLAVLGISGSPAEMGNSDNELGCVKISIFKPADAEYTKFIWSGFLMDFDGENGSFQCGGGQRKSAADVDAVRFHWKSGDYIAVGNIQFFGIAK